DAAIDVAFGSEVGDGPDAAGQYLAHDGAIGDVAANEIKPRMAVQIGEVLEIAGVGQVVQVDDVNVRVGVQHKADEIAADEAAAACHQHRNHADPFPASASLSRSERRQ